MLVRFSIELVSSVGLSAWFSFSGIASHFADCILRGDLADRVGIIFLHMVESVWRTTKNVCLEKKQVGNYSSVSIPATENRLWHDFFI